MTTDWAVLAAPHAEIKPAEGTLLSQKACVWVLRFGAVFMAIMVTACVRPVEKEDEVFEAEKGIQRANAEACSTRTEGSKWGSESLEAASGASGGRGNIITSHLAPPL